MTDTPGEESIDNSQSGSAVPKERRRTVSERLVELIQQRSPLALVYLIATSVSAATIIGAAVVSIHAWYDRTILWQQHAESTITDLEAGYSYGYFTSKLGPPVITRSVALGFSESIFKERGYYVETLTKSSDEVEFYSVLACNNSIRPRLDLSGVGHMTLNVSSFASITSTADYDYSRGTFGLNGGAYLREYDYVGLQASYRTFMWGLSGSCAPNQDNPLLHKLLSHLPAPTTDHLPSQAELAWIRSHATPNEYGVTAPNIHISDLPRDNIGVDSISVSLGRSLFPSIAGQGSMTPCATVAAPPSPSATNAGASTESRPCGVFRPTGS